MKNVMMRRLSQFKYEASSWKRILEFIRQENIQTKNHLAEVVRYSEPENYFLNDVEVLINNLLQIETAIALISEDIGPFERLLDKEFYVDGTSKSITATRHSIMKDIRNLESQFKNTKYEVDSFLNNTLLS
jgi:hypothetical protein